MSDKASSRPSCSKPVSSKLDPQLSNSPPLPTFNILTTCSFEHFVLTPRCKVQAFRSQAAKNIPSYLMVALLGRQPFSLISITMCAQQSEWKKEKYGTLMLVIRSETPQLLQQSQRWKPLSMMKMP